MSKKLILALAVISFAFIGTSFAAVENIKVSGDIAVQAVVRDLTLGSNEDSYYWGLAAYPPNGVEDFLLTQVRLRFDADLTENVGATIRLINEHLWDDEASNDRTGVANNSNSTDICLDLAYIELREFLYQPLTLIVGRQNLRYGNGFIIGDPDTNQGSSGGNLELGSMSTSRPGIAGRDVYGDISIRKSFDAVRAILDYSPYTIDLIYAQINEGWLSEGSTDRADDSRLVGVNAAYDWSSFNGITEGYFYYLENNQFGDTFWIVDGGIASGSVNPAENQAKTYLAGGRFQFDPSDNLTLGLEGAYQFGDVWLPRMDAGNPYHHLNAFAGQFLAEYRFLNDYNAKLNLSYTYLSGNDDLNDDSFGAWSPMFEDQTPAEIMNILFPQTNAHFVAIEGSMMPREDITVGLKYAWAKLAQNTDGVETGGNIFYIPAFGPAADKRYQIDRDKTYLGSEIDAYVLYDYTEDVQIKLISGWFLPGDFFSDTNDQTAYSVRGSMTVNF